MCNDIPNEYHISIKNIYNSLLQSYTRVNELFALKTVDAIRNMASQPSSSSSTPIIWIHDYHLMLAANTIRYEDDITIYHERGNSTSSFHRSLSLISLSYFCLRNICEEEGIKIRMGFFLHIPFPSMDIIRIFPWVDEILMGMLGT